MAVIRAVVTGGTLVIDMACSVRASSSPSSSVLGVGARLVGDRVGSVALCDWVDRVGNGAIIVVPCCFGQLLDAGGRGAPVMRDDQPQPASMRILTVAHGPAGC